MPLRHDATALLARGLTIHEISRSTRRPLSKVIQDLQLQAGEGDVKLSDVYFTIPPERREVLEALILENGTSSPPALQKQAAAKGFEWHELDLYCRLRKPGVFRGDLYEYLADTEVALHHMVRSALMEEFGPEEAQWWRKGVPTSEFSRLNSLRNAVMHPVKGKTWTRDDFAFVRDWHRYFPVPEITRPT